MRAYTTVDEIKSVGGLNIQGTSSTLTDTRILAAIQGVSDEIDTWCNRTFQPWFGTLQMGVQASTGTLPIGDYVALTSVKEDSNNDGTFNTTWGTSDWYDHPPNNDPTSDTGRPFRSLVVNGKSNGTQDIFVGGARRYEVIGTFGFTYVTRAVDNTLDTDVNTTATTINVDNPSGTIKIGQTLQIGTEHLFVSDMGSGSGTVALTVARAQNGSTAGSHGSAGGSTISYFDYPADVKEAAFIQSSRIFQRRQSAFATDVGPEGNTQRRSNQSLDNDVRTLIAGKRRL